MFGFGSEPVSVDWSFYGGLEQLPPHLYGDLPTRGKSNIETTNPTVKQPVSSSVMGSGGTTTSTARLTNSTSIRHRPTTEVTTSSDSNSNDSDSDTYQADTTTPPTSDEELIDQSSPASTFPTDWKSQQTMRQQLASGRKASELGLSDTLEQAQETNQFPVGYPWVPKKRLTPADTQDFLWLLTEEPHRSRRWAILKAHPEVKKLMGYEPLTKWVSGLVVLLQIGMGIGLSYSNWGWISWKFWLITYVIGATATHNLFLAIHEITHNLAFRSINANRSWAILTNLPIGIPYAMMFKRYHMEHHKYMGEDGIDTDLPSQLELWCLNNVLGKAFFATFQILFYALRPGFIRSQRLTSWHMINTSVVLLFDTLIVWIWGWTPFYYFLLSAFLAGSWHPCAGHFIAEHYLFGGIQQETWSYYGRLNWFTYNVGYHNEHHDFPSIAWTKLPALRKMCPEFYDCLPQHTSWPLVMAQFVFGTDSGIWARIKRLPTRGDRGVSEE